jgi:hypothetical protein
MKNEREAVAYHEAGHAVIARALGLEVDCVTIIPDLDLDTAGLCTRDWATAGFYDDLATQLSAIEKDVVVSLASSAAECLYLGLSNLERALSGSDLKMAEHLMKLALERSGRDHSEYDQLFGQFSTETEILVGDHWSAIERVANGLLEFFTLNATDVDGLIAGHAISDGVTHDEAVRRYFGTAY